MLYFLIVTILGFLAGFLSGLLAVGGGIIIIPVFLYVIPLLGFEALSVNQVTGISSVQVIMGSLFAFFAHKKFGLIDKSLIYSVGVPAGIGALTGSVVSKLISPHTLLVVYLTTLIASLVALFLQKTENEGMTSSSQKPVLMIISAFITGVLSGSIGVGGAVLFIPILNYFCNMPFKSCISNTTSIVLLTAIMTFIGKAATSQIPYELVVFVIAGAFLGARLGTLVSHRLPSGILKNILYFIIIITAVRVLISII